MRVHNKRRGPAPETPRVPFCVECQAANFHRAGCKATPKRGQVIQLKQPRRDAEAAE